MYFSLHTCILKAQWRPLSTHESERRDERDLFNLKSNEKSKAWVDTQAKHCFCGKSHAAPLPTRHNIRPAHLFDCLHPNRPTVLCRRHWIIQVTVPAFNNSNTCRDEHSPPPLDREPIRLDFVQHYRARFHRCGTYCCWKGKRRKRYCEDGMWAWLRTRMGRKLYLFCEFSLLACSANSFCARAIWVTFWRLLCPSPH